MSQKDTSWSKPLRRNAKSWPQSRGREEQQQEYYKAEAEQQGRERRKEARKEAGKEEEDGHCTPLVKKKLLTTHFLTPTDLPS
ncbi:unnamed protein product [Sphagnum jensenii]|uniref:Uncharacterized protein n=1 Tax=Sphagnum jensenii TaxID=128206 RepID=A0ABP1A609_9BRYO